MIVRVVPSNSFDLVIEEDDGSPLSSVNVPDWYPNVRFLRRTCRENVDFMLFSSTMNPPSLSYFLSDPCFRLFIIRIISTYGLKSEKNIRRIENLILELDPRHVIHLSMIIISNVSRDMKKKELIRLSKRIRNIMETLHGTDNSEWETLYGSIISYST